MSAAPVTRPERATRRRKLTPESILEVATKILDEEGFAALTMRRLGQELHVDAMSLYNHFENKDALLSAVSASLFAQIEGLKAGGGSWKDDMRAVMVSTYKLGARHPGFVEVLFRGPRGPVQTRGQRDVDVLVAAGFSLRMARSTLAALVSYVVGQLHHSLADMGHRDVNFNFGLDALLAGIELKLAETRSGR